MRITKFVAVAGAVSMLASALPLTVSADDSMQNEYGFIAWRDVENVGDNENCIVITDVQTDNSYYEIPDAIVDTQGVTYTIVGVDDFAFSLCKDLSVVHVPDTLTIDNTGNVAFLTSSSVMDFLNNELSDAATIDDVIRYVAEKANYKDGNFTDEDLADVAVKLEKKLSTVDLSFADTVEGKIMTLIKNVNNMDLNPELLNSFNIWISTVTYNDFALCGSEGSEMQTYAQGRELLGLEYIVDADYVIGDANGDGKFNVRDAAFIASNIAKGVTINPSDNPAADYNDDGAVTVRDAAAMARDLAVVTVG